jgi:hypothetical protein
MSSVKDDWVERVAWRLEALSRSCEISPLPSPEQSRKDLSKLTVPTLSQLHTILSQFSILSKQCGHEVPQVRDYLRNPKE